MNLSQKTIDFLARCIYGNRFDEAEAFDLMTAIGIAIDRASATNRDTRDLQHCHDTLLNLIAER